MQRAEEDLSYIALGCYKMSACDTGVLLVFVLSIPHMMMYRTKGVTVAGCALKPGRVCRFGSSNFHLPSSK